MKTLGRLVHTGVVMLSIVMLALLLTASALLSLGETHSAGKLFPVETVGQATLLWMFLTLCSVYNIWSFWEGSYYQKEEMKS